MALRAFSLIVVHCGLLAAGCAVRQPPDPLVLPSAFAQVSGTSGPPPSLQWYREFESSELNSLIEQAAGANLDVKAARSRVAQADARAREAGAAILPNVDGAGSANYLAGHSVRGGGHELDWSAMLSASYEVDFWGRNRAAAASSTFLAGASRAQRDTVSMTTLAGVASSYFEVLALRERLAIARSNTETAAHLLEVVRARFDAGVASPIELATQITAYDASQLALYALQRSEVDLLAALSTLLGRMPEGFTVVGGRLDSLREPAVDAGLPSELLTRRPDIRQAEDNLRSGRADLQVARAAMFPSLNLTAGAGIQNPALPATVLTIPGVGPSFALGANLLQPIFDHDRLRAHRDEAVAREGELLSDYRASIIAALVDVETALAAVRRLDLTEHFERDSVAQSEQAFDGARMRYEAGSGDFLTLLEAERTMYAARDGFVQYELARLQSKVALCKALGGGWTDGPGVTRNIASIAPEETP